MTGPFIVRDNNLHLNLKIIPSAGYSAFKELTDDYIKVALKAPPVEGKANKELIQWLSKRMKVSKKNISIVKGMKTRLKSVVIKNYNIHSIEEFISLLTK